MLVTRVIGDCPACSKPEAFGNVMVVRDHVLRGCKHCKYSERIPLPGLSKRIIYLDQFFFSAAFRDKDKRFVETAAMIKKAAAAQVLLAPYSSIHEDETHQWRGFNGHTKENLMEFIKATSRGHDFEPAYSVEHDQILDAFDAYLAGRPSDFQLNLKTAIKSRTNQWEDYFRIEVGSYRGDIELIRQLKNQSIDGLINTTFPSWRLSTSTFDEHVQLEMKDAAKFYIKFYLDYLARILGGDYEAMFDSPIISMIVQDMMSVLPRETDANDKIKTIRQFFESDHFFNVPHELISARSFAILREQVRNGAFKNPEDAAGRLSGFFQDVKHFSMYSPYVDAIVVDQPMAAILNDGRLDITRRYGTKVYSLQNWDQLMAWLQSLLDSMSVEHREALAIAYP